jgi:hypothetical protein
MWPNPHADRSQGSNAEAHVIRLEPILLSELIFLPFFLAGP